MDTLHQLPRSLTNKHLSRTALLKTVSLFYNSLDAILVPSQTILNQLASFTTTPLIHLPNSINLRLFSPRSMPKTTDLIYIGRLDPEKNIPLLLQAFQGVHSQLPHLSLTIVGSGTNTQPLSSFLKQNLPLKHLPSQPHHQLPPLYNSARFFVTASTSENNPLTLLEDLACGLQVIAPQAGGIPELISHHHNSLLCQPHSPASLASAITLLATNSSLLRQLTHQTRPSVLAYAQTKIIARTLTLYKNLIAQKKKGLSSRGPSHP